MRGLRRGAGWWVFSYGVLFGMRCSVGGAVVSLFICVGIYFKFLRDRNELNIEIEIIFY